MGKLTISMTIFNSYVNVYQAGYLDVYGNYSINSNHPKTSQNGSTRIESINVASMVLVEGHQLS